jgi:hypothetical protein
MKVAIPNDSEKGAPKNSQHLEKAMKKINST